MNEPAVSVIATTYNRPAALRRVLEGLLQQRHLPAEVIVADDGSGDETRDIVADITRHAPFPIVHVWQEDRGFRAAAARNRAIAASSGDYLVFIDGDSIPCPQFVERHVSLAEVDCFIVGNRVLLSPDLTKAIEAGSSQPCTWSVTEWVRHRIRGHVNRVLPLLYLPDGRWRKRRPAEWRGARTCNLAAWRSHLDDVNGFDERYEGWGHEDADLVARLIGRGVRRKDGHWAVPVLHLWHPENDRHQEAENASRLQLVLAHAQRDYRAELGLSQYL